MITELHIHSVWPEHLTTLTMRNVSGKRVFRKIHQGSYYYSLNGVVLRIHVCLSTFTI